MDLRQILRKKGLEEILRKNGHMGDTKTQGHKDTGTQRHRRERLSTDISEGLKGN